MMRMAHSNDTIKKWPFIKAEQKCNHVSWYAAFNNTFTYNPQENDTLDDFLNLSVPKVQNIASTLKITDVKKYEKRRIDSSFVK